MLVVLSLRNKDYILIFVHPREFVFFEWKRSIANQSYAPHNGKKECLTTVYSATEKQQHMF